MVFGPAASGAAEPRLPTLSHLQPINGATIRDIGRPWQADISCRLEADPAESPACACDHVASASNDIRWSEDGYRALLPPRQTYRTYPRLHPLENLFSTMAEEMERQWAAAMER